VIETILAAADALEPVAARDLAPHLVPELVTLLSRTGCVGFKSRPQSVHVVIVGSFARGQSTATTFLSTDQWSGHPKRVDVVVPPR
jgi:hypothetical protein